MVRSELFGCGPHRGAPNGTPGGMPIGSVGGFMGGDRVGLELEIVPMLRRADGSPRPVPLHGPGPTIEMVFHRLAESEGWSVVAEQGVSMVRTRSGGTITLEPAGQIEYSGPPFSEAARALADLAAAFDAIESACAALGIELAQRGYNNLIDEELLALQVRKPRYLAMERHFDAIGPFGRKMMRATCALQINLDFGPATAVARRWRLANMMAPSLNAIFANAPHRHNGRRYRSFRYEIWRHADPTRTGRLLDSPDLDPVDDYLRFALDATVMMVRAGTHNVHPPSHRLTFGAWLAGDAAYGFPDWDDWRLHLSTLFPDVRARGWMEIRSIDLLPREWWSVPVAMTSALLYTDAVCVEALERLERRARVPIPGEYEHSGCWHADYSTGAELLDLALPHITDPALRARAAEFGDRFCGNRRTPGEEIEALDVVQRG